MRFGDLVATGDRWIISKFYDWLEIRDNKGESAKEADILNHILTKNSHRVREGSWSASSTGSCHRKQQFVFHGVAKTPYASSTRGIFVNGDYVHLKHQVAGLRMGYLKDVEIPVRYPELNLTGTIDGITSEDAIVDFKSINSRGFGDLIAARRDHVQQVHSYMLATGLQKGMVLYENKDNQEMKEFHFDRDEEIIEKIRSGYEELNALEDQGILAEPLPDPSCFECRYCPFNRTCRKLTTKEVFGGSDAS